MKRQELQVALDKAYEEMKQRAYKTWFRPNLQMNGGIVTSLDRWANAVTEPDCSYNFKKADTRDPEEGGYMWEPKGRVKAYFTTLPCEAAVKLCEDINSDGGDALLMPPTSGGWGPTMGTLRKHNILQEYPSMLDKPWRKAAALRLSVRTRKENHGRRIETIKEISVSPM